MPPIARGSGVVQGDVWHPVIGGGQPRHAHHPIVPMSARLSSWQIGVS
jgi:hypothetical protein